MTPAATGLTRRRLGHTDITVPSLCLGTMMYGEQINEEDAFAQMDACLQRGIDFFDTAELYTVPPKAETQGNTERIIGNWLKARGGRDKIIIASKVTGRAHMPWFREDSNETRLTRKQINYAVEQSLKRLQTDYLDLYQLHWPDRKTALFGGDYRGYHFFDDEFVAFQDILETLADLQKQGKVRHFGISNETPYGTMKFLELAKTHNLPRMVSIQNCYNLLGRTYETGLAEITMHEKIGLLAYSPIAQGMLSGKYLNGAKPKGSRGEMFGRLDRYERPNADEAIRSYMEVAKNFGISPVALAMQFVTTRPWVTSNIFGARGMDQLEVIFSSLEVEWTDELNKAINEVHERFPNPCP